MKQHYIPRCYLRRFSKKDNSICTYDKVSCKIYNANMFSVCCEKDMYTLSDEYVQRCREENGQEINRLTIEKEHFAKDVGAKGDRNFLPFVFEGKRGQELFARCVRLEYFRLEI